MAIVASSKGERTLPPTGTHVGRCYLMVDLGTQREEYQGKPRKARKVLIGWELPEEKHIFKPENGPEPFTISKRFTLSLSNKATLKAVLESWRGKPFTAEEEKGFDLTKIVGAYAMLTVIHETGQNGDYAKLTNITCLPKNMPKPAGCNKPLVYEIAMGRSGTFSTLPQWMQDIIVTSDEIRDTPPPEADGSTEANEGGGPVDDSTPF